jgi:hypothetical protein
VYDEPRRLDLDVSGSVAGNLDRLPEYQNVAVNVKRLYSVDARLSYTDVRTSLGSVDDEIGTRWTMAVLGRVVDGTAVPRVYGTYDRGLALPIGHSSIWLRNAIGFSPRDRREPFANFYFGGFGNNYIDHLDEKRYREYYSFPGEELNAIGGRNFARSLLEWNLPPWRFRRAGTPGFYASWARPALFVAGLTTNVDDPAVRRSAMSAGGQLDVRMSMLSALDLTLSIGAAIAIEQGKPPGRELMLSLKILR